MHCRRCRRTARTWHCACHADVVTCALQEVPENGADVAHLSQVHGPIMTAGVDLRYTYSRWWSFARHNWQGEWSADADEKHVGVMNLLHSVQVFRWRFPVLDLRVCARQVNQSINQ